MLTERADALKVNDQPAHFDFCHLHAKQVGSVNARQRLKAAVLKGLKFAIWATVMQN